MLGLGSSDSLRGIFSPCFSGTLQCRRQRTVHDGGDQLRGQPAVFKCWREMMDTFDRKKVAMGMLGIWMAAVLLNVLTDSYPMILLSMFLALGASNYVKYYRESVNAHGLCRICRNDGQYLFFIQGIGTSGSQFLLGRFAFSYDGWKMINACFLRSGW